MRLGEIAERLGGREVEGDADLQILGVAGLPEAGPEDLSFIRSIAYAKELAVSKAAAVVAPVGLETGGRATLRSPNPNLDFARAAALLNPTAGPEPGVHASACVDSGAAVHPEASVGPCAVVEAGARVGARSRLGANATVGARATVGEDCVLHAGCVIEHDVRLGDRVVLQPGAVIGGDGFGYELDEAGRLEKVPQVGTVVIEDDVEVGANATVDRARVGATRIGRGAKIDNLVQIGHNCDVGEHVVVVAQAGLAGSTVLEDRVVVLAQAGLANHVRIGRGSILGARAGAIADVPEGSRVFGFPALPGRAWHRSISWFARLPELARRIKALEKRIVADEAPAEDEVQLR